MLRRDSSYASGAVNGTSRQDSRLAAVWQVSGAPFSEDPLTEAQLPEITTLLCSVDNNLGMRRSLELVRTVAERLSSPCYLYDLCSAQFVWANRVFKRAFASDPDGRALEHLAYFDGPAPSAEHRDRLRQARDGDIVSTERRLRSGDGQSHWYRFREAVIARDRDNAPTLVLGLAEDITACKLAELEAQRTEELNAAERRQRRLFETALELVPQGVAILDGQQLRVQWNNQAFHEYLDESLYDVDVTGKLLQEIMPHVAGTGLDEVIRKVLASGRACSDLRYVVDGQRHDPRYWRISLQPLPGSDDHGNLLLQIDDVTEQLRPNKWVAAHAGAVRVRS